MKKVLVLIFSLLFSLSAATESSKALLFLNMSNNQIYEFGFSEVAVSSYADSVVSPTSPHEVEATNGKTYAEDSDIFFYWKILADDNTKLELSLKLEGPMVCEDPAGELGWNIRWDRTSVTPGGSVSSDSDSEVIVYTYGDGSQVNAGSVRLYMWTDDFVGKPAGTYEGTVTATIRNKG